MNRLPQGLLVAAILLGGVLITVPDAEAGTSGFLFGMEASSVNHQTSAGVKPDVGTFWVGPWTLKSGWAGPDAQMQKMRSAGVTPAIHLYYWGDDISPNCVEHGCWSSLHGAHKNRAEWQKLTQQLVNHLHQQMQGREVVIFLETEFNKGGISTYEPFDGYMAAKAKFIKDNYPNAKVVMSMGNWDSGNWYRFDRTAAASDWAGIQAMRGSTKDSYSHYMNAYEATLSGAKKMNNLFGKPVLITDLALSSYPDSTYKWHQANELKEFFNGVDQLKAAGVKGIIYRSWYDAPNMDLANYYGHAERHWGMTYSGGAWKPAASVWVDGVKSVRSGSSPSSSPSSPAGSGEFSAKFAPSPSSNEWWVDVKVDATKSLNRVEVKVNGGSYVTLDKNSWGTYSKSVHAPKGSSVEFRAVAHDGSVAKSGTYKWLVSSTPTSGSGSTTSPSGDFDARFAPSSSSNEWWVDVKVDTTKSLNRVEVKVNGGSYVTLDKNSWGSHSKSVHAPKGASVEFRAVGHDGSIAKSGTYNWLVSSTPSGDSGSSSSPSGDFSAKFAPSSSSNEWWVDVKVDTSKPLNRVEVKVNGGSYVKLDKTSWGSYAKSVHAPKGASVEFRAVGTDGSIAKSPQYTWLSGTSSGSSGFDASFAVKDTTNNWWVETTVTSKASIGKVEVKVNSGAWQTLPKASWGAYAKSIHVPDGAKVQFRATNGAGSTDLSQTFTWS